MIYLVCLWLFLGFTFMAGWSLSIFQDIKEKERFARRMEHISTVFYHTHNVVQMFRDSRIRHWSVGCEELRRSTMLEE